MDPGSKLNPLVSAQRQEHNCYVVIIIIHFEYNVISKPTIGSVMLYTYCKTTLLCMYKYKSILEILSLTKLL